MTATHDAIAEAIRAHVAAEADGAYLTDWVLVAAGAVPAEANSTIYVTECSDGPAHHRLGLVRYLHLRSDEMMTDDDDA